jgi:hypothetical protein
MQDSDNQEGEGRSHPLLLSDSTAEPEPTCNDKVPQHFVALILCGEPEKSSDDQGTA